MISFGIYPWPLFVCAAATAALTWITYRHSVPRPAGIRFVFLASLRFAALFLVLFLLFQPIWKNDSVNEHPAVLAVLVDNSQSLRLDSTAAAKEIASSLPPVDVRMYAFSNSTHPLATPDSLHFDGTRTNISRALTEVYDAMKEENLRGVLLITDGQYNTGRNPVYTAERYGLPIHTIAVGDTMEQRDLRIRRVTTNELGYMNQSLPVQVELQTEGIANDNVTVSLFLEDEVLQSRTLQLPETPANLTVDLDYTPAKEGIHQLHVAVTQLQGEVTHRNNTETFTVRVLPNKRRVLLLAAAPGPDLASIMQLLQKSGDTEVVSYVQKGPDSFYEGELPTSLADFDLLLLVGFPGNRTDINAQEHIVRTVMDNQVPLLFFVNKQTNINALETLGAALPVTLERTQSGFDESALVPSLIGKQHPILDMDIPAGPDVLGQLPPLYYSRSSWQTSPDARILAHARDTNTPLLVTRNRAGNRSAVLLGTGMWRWNNLPEDLGEYETVWPRLLGNLVQWLSTPGDDSLVRVRPTQDVFGGRDAIPFTGQVYDESLNPIHDASITVNLTTPDSVSYPYIMEALGDGRYTLETGTLPEGTYSYEAIATHRNSIIGRDTGTFSVGALSLEYKETRTNIPLLRQIAQRSGGQFIPFSSMQTLGNILAADSLFQPLSIRETRLTNLWQLPLFLFLTILFVTTEWVLRKRWGMV